MTSPPLLVFEKRYRGDIDGFRHDMATLKVSESDLDRIMRQEAVLLDNGSARDRQVLWALRRPCELPEMPNPVRLSLSELVLVHTHLVHYLACAERDGEAVTVPDWAGQAFDPRRLAMPSVFKHEYHDRLRALHERPSRGGPDEERITQLWLLDAARVGKYLPHLTDR